MSRLSSLVRIAAPLALLAATGCAQSFNAKVSRFQAMPAPQGQSFAIKAADPARDGGLEFAQYANIVAGKLTALGYSQAANPAQASFVVSLDYGVDGGKEKIRTVPGSSFSRYGSCWSYFDPWCRGVGFRPYSWRYGRYAYGWNDPFLFGPGYGDEIESYPVYTSGIDMKIERAGGERLFEGSAKAQSLNNDLTYLVPNLIEAMFTGFPGNSGETVKITVPPPAKAKKV